MSCLGANVAYREVPGFPAYIAGNDGSVWSCWKRGRVTQKTTKWRRLRPRAVSKYGYLGVALFPGPVRKLVHRLVLEAFVGPCPAGMECCHHPDPNPANNVLANLRWDTSAANKADTALQGGSMVRNAKLSPMDAKAIRTARKNGSSLKQLALAHNVSEATVSRIGNGKIWKKDAEDDDGEE